MGSDYLTCGQCLKEFPLQKITLFIQHKQFDCDEVNRAQFGETDLKCYYCPRGFVSAWGLLVHVQVTHSLHIFVEHASISLSTQHNLENSINTFKPTLTQNTFEKEHCNEIKECSSSKRILSVKNNDFESRNALNADDLITEAEVDNSFENNSSVKEETMNTKLVSKKSILLSDTDSSLKTTVQGKKEMMQTSNSSYRTSVVDVSPIASLSNLSSPILSVKAKFSTKGIQDLPKPPQLVSDNHVSLISQDKEDGSKQDIVEPRKSTGVADKLSPNDGSCCDNQGCGITVIPGSHQDLQKCCNAVVPKKRKRHMEMKHMPFSWSSSKYARMRMLKRSLVSGSKSKSSYAGLSACGTRTIFIDVEPNTFIDIDKEQASHHQHDMNVDIPVMDANIGANKSKNISHGYENRAKSLLLKPGAVFSIPFSYSMPSSVPGTPTSIPISIIQQIAGKKTSNLVTRSKLPINGNKLNDDQIQLESMSEAENMGLNEKMKVTDSEVKRRKYPTSKPFQCDTCPMAFNQRIHLKKHTSKHTGIKPYKCDECDYSTVERSHLKVHIRIHTGEKPFKCTYCEYATAQNSTLKIHLKRHHGSTLFACDSTDKLFTQIEQLKSHEFDHPNTSINIQKKKTSDAESKLTIDEKEKPSVERDEAGDCETNANLAPVLPYVDTGHVLCISEEL